MKKPRCSYRIAKVTDTFIFLVDTGETVRSVTNELERLVPWLDHHIEGGLGRRHLVYRDSQGGIDEVRHEGGKFVGFIYSTRSQMAFYEQFV